VKIHFAATEASPQITVHASVRRSAPLAPGRGASRREKRAPCFDAGATPDRVDPVPRGLV